VGLALDDEEMVRAAYSGPSGFRDQLEKGVIPPGVWYEGAWGYHFYTMSALLPFVEAGARAGLDVPLDQCRAMYEAPMDFVAQDMLLPAFNDSGYVNLAGSAGIYAIASRHWPDPRLAWVAAMKPPGSWTGLVWAARDLPAAEARREWGGLLGVSASTVEQVVRARRDGAVAFPPHASAAADR